MGSGEVQPEVDDSNVLGLHGASRDDDVMRQTTASNMVAVAVQIVCTCGAWAWPELRDFAEKREGREGVFIKRKAWVRG
jgi:hypothetical protein